ncbi:MAG: glycerate kinase family protein [Actinomycetota bacterium]
MRVVVAPDKFEGTLTAPQVARALAAGWRRADPRAEVAEVPVADGGKGTLATLLVALGGRSERVRVTGPLGDPVDADFGLAETDRGLTAIVEMAEASGLSLVSEGRRDPLRATSRGTGELLLAAARHRPRRILVGIGGSATTDAGAGMAQAIGVRLLDDRGLELEPGGAELRRLSLIDGSGIDRRLQDPEVVVACDVDNPLLGPHGAARTYGPQKGASPDEVVLLDEALAHFAFVVHRDVGLDVRELPGAGGAGGLPAGLAAFLGARLRPGFDLVADAVGLPRRLGVADVAITGEGRYDRQTERGKAPSGVLRLAREAGCRTVVVAGQIEEGVTPPAELVYSLAARAGLRAAMERAAELLEETAAEAAGSLAEPD